MPPAAILAGGLGTRLYPLTESMPKALVEINGEPFLAHQLRLLRARGIERVVLLIGQHGERIREYAGDGARFGLAIDYSADGPVLLGTAGAVRQALPLLGERVLRVVRRFVFTLFVSGRSGRVPRRRPAWPDDRLSQRGPLGHE